jgi:diguanylate cyclase (GGDEF)-like protein
MTDKLALLIIEDSAAERALVDAALAEFPAIERRMADSLRDAQRAIDRAPPDVVLLDLELPDARGLEGVAWLQRRNPTLPIVVLSGFGADDLLVACEAIELGAQEFLGKSRLDGDNLLRVLQLARARKQREVAALAAALRDPLTGLPRPALLEERASRSLARGRRQRSSLALLHIDVDGFAAFAEAVGSEQAEACLVAIADRLAGELRSTDSLARLDGAAFLVMVDGMKHGTDAYVVARKLLAAMRRPLTGAPQYPAGVEATPLRLSVGVTQWLSDGTQADAERTGIGDFGRRRADAEAAMYEARRQGGDRYVAACDLAPAAG